MPVCLPSEEKSLKCHVTSFKTSNASDDVIVSKVKAEVLKEDKCTNLTAENKNNSTSGDICVQIDDVTELCEVSR